MIDGKKKTVKGYTKDEIIEILGKIKSLLERFLNVAHNVSSNPKMCKDAKNIKIFEEFSKRLFNPNYPRQYNSDKKAVQDTVGDYWMNNSGLTKYF